MGRKNITPSESLQKNLIMMIGLPASGKSTWVQSQIRKNPKKNYYVLSTENYFHDMTFGNYRLQFIRASIDRMMDISIDLFKNSLCIARNKNKNFIIDQCNCLLFPRLEKLAMFHDFKRIGICIVNNNFEQNQRNLIANRKNKNFPKAPEEGILNFKENFVLPEKSSYEFDEVFYPVLSKDEAQKVLSKNYLEIRKYREVQREQMDLKVSKQCNQELNTFLIKKSSYYDPAYLELLEKQLSPLQSEMSRLIFQLQSISKLQRNSCLLPNLEDQAQK